MLRNYKEIIKSARAKAKRTEKDLQNRILQANFASKNKKISSQ
jgi:hypothetical protein